MQRTIAIDRLSLGELYSILYNQSKDIYKCFIDRKDGGGNNLSKLLNDLNISSVVNDNELIDIWVGHRQKFNER